MGFCPDSLWRHLTLDYCLAWQGIFASQRAIFVYDIKQIVAVCRRVGISAAAIVRRES